jgi:uncharacterized membrane protein YbhN (UPF0104 family)
MLALSSPVHRAGSRRGRLVLTAGAGALGLALAVLAARHVAESPWPLSQGHPGLLVAAAVLSLLGYGFKAYGWQRLIAREERPRSLALAAASGGASISGLVLPGRFDDVVRIAIVRRYPGCPAGIRTLCLSLFMLGLIDTVALAPLAIAAAVLPGQPVAARIGLAVIAGAGLGAALLVLGLPRLLASRRFLPLRLGRWLRPRTTSFREAAQAWALVSTCWLMRTAGVVLLLGTLGVGFSLPLALLFLCASSAAAALPIGPGGAATQAGAGAAVLIASGAGASEAVAVAIAVQALGIIAGGSILLFAAAWRTCLWATTRIDRAPVPVRAEHQSVVAG